MSNWLALNPEEINKGEKQRLQGVDVTLYVSPQDVPDAVRGQYIPDGRKFEIQFRYPGGDESLERGGEKQGVTLWIGKRSRRLHLIQIEVEHPPAEPVAVTVEIKHKLHALPSAIKELSEREGTPSRQGNYAVARDVVGRRRDELLQGIGT